MRAEPIPAVLRSEHLDGVSKRVRAYPEGLTVCPWCSTGIAHELRLCTGCNVYFQPQRGQRSQFCSDRCRQRARTKRIKDLTRAPRSAQSIGNGKSSPPAAE